MDKKVDERRDKIYNSDKSRISILPAFKAAIERSKQVSSNSDCVAHLFSSRERPSCPPPQNRPRRSARKNPNSRRRSCRTRRRSGSSSCTTPSPTSMRSSETKLSTSRTPTSRCSPTSSSRPSDSANRRKNFKRASKMQVSVNSQRTLLRYQWPLLAVESCERSVSDELVHPNA